MNNQETGIYRSILKPMVDIGIGLTGFVFLFPLFIIVVVLLFFANNGKVFFLQRRPGKNERIFSIIKFRTMNDKRDMEGNLLPDAMRLTAIGRFIRKTSLDEIPQLLNLIKGDMSLVGPRPLLVEYLPLYNDVQRKRHLVKPGITGWAQVNGRNAISWEEKFDYDVWYVENRSLSVDIKIIMKTVTKVFKQQDINQPGQATMDYFQGSLNK